MVDRHAPDRRVPVVEIPIPDPIHFHPIPDIPHFPNIPRTNHNNNDTIVNKFTSYNKDPPNIKDCKSYEEWLQLLNDWSSCTTLPKTKQGPALRLSLSGEAREAALQIDDDDVSSDIGIDIIKDKLKNLFVKNTSHRKYNLLEEFVSFKRKSDMNIQQYVIEFENKLYQTTKYGTKWPDDILAFWLLKNANLAENQQQLAKACSDISYSTMKDKLITIFGEAKSIVPEENIFINENYSENTTEQCLYATDNHDIHESSQQYLECQQIDHSQENDFQEEYSEAAEDTFFTQNNRFNNNQFRPQSRFSQRPYMSTQRYNQPYVSARRFNRPTRFSMNSQQNFPRFSNNTNYRFSQPNLMPRYSTQFQPRRFYTQQGQQNKIQTPRKINPPSRCAICQSITHFASNCPNSYEYNQNTMYTSDLSNQL